MGHADETEPAVWQTGPGLFEAAWRHRWLIIVATLVAASAAYGVSLLQPVVYRAEARLLLSDPRNTGAFRDELTTVIDPARYARNQAEIVGSLRVAGRVVELVGADLNVGIDELEEQVDVSSSADVDTIEIAATAGDPQDAAALANAVGDAYQQLSAERGREAARDAVAELSQSQEQLESEIADADARRAANPDRAAAARSSSAAEALAELESRAGQIAIDAALFGAGVDLFDRAKVPEQPVEPQPLRNGLLAAVLGLLGSSAFAWWRAEYTQSADRRDDAAAILGAPCLGQVPDFAAVGVNGPLPTVDAVRSSAGEAYHFIVTAIELAVPNRQRLCLAVSSAGPGDGKTTTTANLGTAAGMAGRLVLVVDADERRRALSRMADAEESRGLTDLAHEALPFEAAVSPKALLESPPVGVVPAGSKVEDSAAFFRSAQFRTALGRVRASADFTVVDTPPLLAVADTAPVAAQCDHLVLVVKAGTPLRVLQDVRERLDLVGADLLGYIFNRARPSGGRLGPFGRHRYGPYGYSAYGYGSSTNGHHGKTAAAVLDDELLDDDGGARTNGKARRKKKRGRRAGPFRRRRLRAPHADADVMADSMASGALPDWDGPA